MREPLKIFAWLCKIAGVVFWLGVAWVTIAAFAAIAQFAVPGADDSSFVLSFMIPAGVCIAIFVFINRKDPTVTK